MFHIKAIPGGSAHVCVRACVPGCFVLLTDFCSAYPMSLLVVNVVHLLHWHTEENNLYFYVDAKTYKSYKLYFWKT